MNSNIKRSEIYIDTQIQFRHVVVLIVLITLESFLVTGGVYLIFNLQKSFAEVSRLSFIYISFLALFLLTVLLNAFVGIRLSHKVAGPVFNFRKAVRMLRGGIIPQSVVLRDSDLLQDLEYDFNDMLQNLNLIQQQDQKKKSHFMAVLSKIRAELNKADLKNDLEKEIGALEDYMRSSFFQQENEK